MLGASVRQVRNWESGRVRCPQTWFLIRMNHLHGTTGPEELGFKSRLGRHGPATVEQGDRAEADLFRRDFLGWVAAIAFSSRPVESISGLLLPTTTSGAVGQADVERITRTNQALFDADFLIGGAAFRHEALIAQFRNAASVLHERFANDATRGDAHSAVGHLGSTIGFMLFDQGRHREARQVYGASLRVAQQADERWPLRAIIFSEMARQCVHLGQYAHAGELLRMARGAEAEVPPAFHAMLYAVQAGAHAGAARATDVRDAIARAEDTFSDASTANDPSWISWFDRAELDGETGNALSSLAIKHESFRGEAADRLMRSANGHGPTDQRSRALALIRLARIHAATRDKGATVQAAIRVHKVARHLQSPRVSDELEALRRGLVPMLDDEEISLVDRDLAALTS
jgi:hypothetical protein